MTIKNVIQKFQQDKGILLAIRKNNLDNALAWLNGEGLNLAYNFKSEITKNETWQCEIKIERLSQASEKKLIEIYVYQKCRDKFGTSIITDIIITIEYKLENKEYFLVTLSNGNRILESQKQHLSKIDMALLEGLLTVGLKEFYLNPLK